MNLLALHSDLRAAKLELLGHALRGCTRPGAARAALDRGEVCEHAMNGGVHRQSLPAVIAGVTDAALG